MLNDWDRMVDQLDRLLPKPMPASALAGDANRRNLAGFVRGQITVCFLLAVFYATAFRRRPMPALSWALRQGLQVLFLMSARCLAWRWDWQWGWGSSARIM